MSKSLKIAIVAVVFIALVIWNYTYKQTIDTYFSNYTSTTTTLRDLKDTLQALKYATEESILFQYYNNDRINEKFLSLQKMFKVLESSAIYEKRYYDQTRVKLQQLEDAVRQKRALTEKLFELNARVKNSLSYLSSQIYQLDPFDKRYSQDVMKLLNYFYQVKNTLEYDQQRARELAKVLKGYSFEQKEKKLFHKLLQVHTDTLLKQLPEYIKTIAQSVSDREQKLVDETIAAYVKNSAHVRKNLNIQVFLIVLFSILGLAVILYFIFETEREKHTIMRLQKEY